MPTDFLSLDLPDSVMQGIQAAGFTTCTPIQEEVLPITLRGRDVAGQAQTGTGKTAAFLVSAFTRLLREPDRRRGKLASPRALIIAPTRELAVQIHGDAELLGRFVGLDMQVVYGGVDYLKQRQTLRAGVDILIGTPGRLIDYLKQGVYTLEAIEIFVIDEADRMFDMGFIKDVRFLVRRMPAPELRQSCLFSATLSQQVLELAYESMNQPTMVAVAPEQVTAEGVEEVLYHVSRDEKFSLLLGVLRQEQGKRILIFSNMKHQAERLERNLMRHGYHARAITGDVDQRKRLKIMQDFKEGGLHILVATDVASRGLHIEGVTHVINYDLPQDPGDYVHRVGRTARAGASGKAVSFADEEFVLSLESIEELIGHKIPVIWAKDALYLDPAPPRHATAPPPAAETPPPDETPAPRRKRPAGGSGRSGSPPPAPGAPTAAEGPDATPRKRRRRRRNPPAGSQTDQP